MKITVRQGARDKILPRDVEVAEFIARGMNRVVIAERLGVSLSTVGRQIGKMYRLTGTTSQPQMIQALRDAGHLPGGRKRVTVVARPGERAASIVRSAFVPDPAGDVDEHVNAVLESVAVRLEREL